MESNFTKMSRIVIAIATYWVVSISLVFLNKYLLSSKDLKMDAPYFITWFQCFMTVILCFFFAILGWAFPSSISFPSPKIDPRLMRDVLPLSVIFLGMITFNNLNLKNISVSFYFLSRSLVTLFNVILSYFILHQTTSFRICCCCGLLMFGFALGVNQEEFSGHSSRSGVLFGLAASIIVPLNAVFTKRMLPVFENSVWKLTMYNNLNCVLLFLPLVFISGDAQKLINFPNLGSSHLWSAMIITGIFGFAMGYVTGQQINVTTPLTHCVSGAAKSSVQTILGVIIYMEVKTSLWWFSNLVSLTSTVLYAFVRHSEMKKAQEKEAENLTEMAEKGIKPTEET